MFTITLGEEIKQKRLEKNMSRAELARLADIPLRTLEDWEYGKNNATHIKVIRVCNILGIDINKYI